MTHVRIHSTLAVALLGAALGAPAHPQEGAPVLVPADMETASLPARREAQLATRSRFGVFHGFGFEDRRAASGIAFRHGMVDDAGLTHKPVHYDHGNGLAVADVDGDGRLDLYFTTQLGGNALYRNLGGGRFEDATAKSPALAMTDRVSVSASFADVDNDGDPDLFVTTVRTGNALFENDGKGVFRDVTKEAGLGYVGHSSAGVFFDYDRDGLLDLFLANVGVFTTGERGRGGYYVGVTDAFAGHLRPERLEASVLYRNLGGRKFEDVTREALLVDRGWNGDATPVDWNGDGFQDLYVLNMQGDDRSWENVQGRFFVERTAKLFPQTPWGTMGVKSFDWNNDGRMDLLLTDMHSDMSENVGPEREKLKSRMQWSDEFLQGGADNLFGNAFYEATAEGGFREISDQVGAENYWPWGVSVGDLNADGWQDVFVTASMNYPFRYGVNSVLLNDRGTTFRDAEFILGIEPRKGELVQPWFDLDCSVSSGGAGEAPKTEWKGIGGEAGGHGGHGEGGAAAAKPAGRHPHCEGRSGRITVMAARGSRSSALFDLEGDGDLDVVTNELNAEPLVLVSDLAQQRKVNFVEVKLRGTRSNRDGLGAKVTVRAGGSSWTQVADGASGYLSHSVMPLYFGLGEATKIDRIEVLWPSGATQVVEAAKANARVEIVEPDKS